MGHRGNWCASAIVRNLSVSPGIARNNCPELPGIARNCPECLFGERVFRCSTCEARSAFKTFFVSQTIKVFKQENTAAFLALGGVRGPVVWCPPADVVFSCWSRAEVGCCEKNQRRLRCEPPPLTSSLCVSGGAKRSPIGASALRRPGPPRVASGRSDCAIAFGRFLTDFYGPRDFHVPWLRRRLQ